MSLVSIILPYKNASAWLNETLQSISDQTYTNWELIAINDHSTDSSDAQLIAFQKAYPQKTKLFQNPGIGIIPALKLGLQESTGEFITRIDADDIMPVMRLEEHLRLLADKKHTVATGKVVYFSETEISPGYIAYQNWLNDRVNLSDHFKHIYRECVIASPNWMCRKADLIKHGIFDNLKYPEDYDIVLKWYEHNFNIIASEETTLMWREHPERTSRTSENYQQPSFFQLKIERFVELELKELETIGIVGKGQKALICEEILRDKNVSVKVFSEMDTLDQELETLHPDKLLIAFYSSVTTEELSDYLKPFGYEIGVNAWIV